MSSCILTLTGSFVDPLALRPADINILDIAGALAKMCRFNGHTSEFYSVAQHSVLVSRHVGDDPLVQLRALLHDASEAYIADITRPVKQSDAFAPYRGIESNIQAAVYAHFGLLVEDAAADNLVAKADELMLAAEFRDLVTHAPKFWADRCRSVLRIKALYCERAELLFMRRFTEITGAAHAA